MSRKAKSSANSGSSNGYTHNPASSDWGGFINVRLTDQDKSDFNVWNADHSPSLWVTFQEYVSEGFKFSLSYDADGDFFLATFTASGLDLIGLDLRCCLTARAPEWETAISLLIFKHEVMAQKNWGSYRPAENRFDRLG